MSRTQSPGKHSAWGQRDQLQTLNVHLPSSGRTSGSYSPSLCFLSSSVRCRCKWSDI